MEEKVNTIEISKIFVLSRYVFTALNFLSVIIITSLLSISDFGELSFFRLMLQYLLYSEFGFIQYIFRKRSADGYISEYELSSVLSYLAISVFSFLFIFSLLDLSLGAFFSNGLYVLLAVLATLFGISSKIVVDHLRISKQVKKLVALEFITNAIVYATVILCWLLSYTSVDVFAAMYGLYLAPYAIFLFFLPLKFGRINKFRFKLQLDKRIIYASSMLFAFGFLSLIFSSIDRLIVRYYLDLEFLGLYAMAFTVSTGLYMVIQTITWMNMSGLINIIKSESKSESTASFKEYMWKIQVIYLFVVTLGLPLYYFLIEYFIPKYNDTFWIFVLLAIYNYVNIFYIYHRTYLLTFEHYKLLNISLSVGIGINVLVSLYLVQFQSLEILVFGSTLSHFFYMIIVRSLVTRIKN